MILKPILVVVTLILYVKGKYKDGNFNPKQSYLYLTIIYTISYTMALYVLALFYVACKDLLQPFNPVPKFIIIKSVVFLTYWQVLFMHLSFNGLFFPCNIKLYLLLTVLFVTMAASLSRYIKNFINLFTLRILSLLSSVYRVGLFFSFMVF